jgi:Undecaprenyl-phosphate glucose phosphotransferase
MAEADHFVSDAERRALAQRDEVTHRLLLCAVVALVESIGAFAIVVFTALAYHLAALQQPIDTFDAFLYIAYGLLAAFIYATFAAMACSRFLENNVSTQPSIHNAVLAWTATVALTLLIAFLSGRVGDFSRVSLASAYLAGLPLTFAIRRSLHSLLNAMITNGELQFESVALIGKRDDIHAFLQGGEIERQGHKLRGTLYLEDVRAEDGTLRAEAVTAFAARNLRLGTKQIVFVGSVAELDEFDTIVGELKRYALNLLYAPASRNRSLKLLDVIAIGPNNVVRFVRTPMNESSVLLKRVVDLVLSALGLVLLAPLFALVALAIMLESRGPVIYRQARRGFNGETFMIWKFRSMSVTESGHAMTQARPHDPRVTRIGRFIRATSIDELPQLVNVLLGQMSLVGPRPHAISHDAELSTRMAQYAHRQRIKPGITGWAQVNGFRGETANAAQLEGRVAHDIYYIDNWSLLLDIWVLILTIFSPAARRNAR